MYIYIYIALFWRLTINLQAGLPNKTTSYIFTAQSSK